MSPLSSSCNRRSVNGFPEIIRSSYLLDDDRKTSHPMIFSDGCEFDSKMFALIRGH